MEFGIISRLELRFLYFTQLGFFPAIRIRCTGWLGDKRPWDNVQNTVNVLFSLCMGEQKHQAKFCSLFWGHSKNRSCMNMIFHSCVEGACLTACVCARARARVCVQLYFGLAAEV